MADMKIEDFDQFQISLSEKSERIKPILLAKLKCNTINKRVFSKSIETHFGITGSKVRQIMKALRREGHPIASSGKGYFYAQSIEEIKPTLDHMKLRRDSLANTIQAMSNGSLFTVNQEMLDLNID